MLSTKILLSLLGYYVINAGVGAMPKPGPNSGAFYVWLFGFFQTLCANADRLAEARFGHLLNPGSPDPNA